MAVTGGYEGRIILPSSSSRYLELLADGESMPRLVLRPDGIFVGNGSSDPTPYSGSGVLNSLASSSASQSFDMASFDVHEITLTQNTTAVFNGTAGFRRYTFVIHQDGVTGGWTFTWPGSVIWYGRPPVINDTPSSTTLVELYTTDGGTTYIGLAAQPDPDSRMMAGAQECLPRSMIIRAVSPGTGIIRLQYFTAEASATYTKLATATGGTAAGATPTQAEVGVYAVTDEMTGAVGTLLGTSGDLSGTLWSATETIYETALTTPVTLVAGVRYASAVLCESAAAMPTLLAATFAGGGSTACAAVHALGPARFRAQGGYSALPVDGSVITPTNSTVPVWSELRP